MKKLLILLLPSLISACAYTTSKPVEYASKEEGFRIYDPKPVLVITCQSVQIATLPDFTRGYAVNFDAVLAKNTSSVQVTEGQLTQASANLDDTAPLQLLQAWGEKALGSAQALAALGSPVSGTIPGMLGIWLIDYSPDGNIASLHPITPMSLMDKPCPGNGGVPVVPAAPAPAAPPAGHKQ